jgi:predicted sulfurtransferase
MQHWRTYKKWNKRLFEEIYAGRSEEDPSEGLFKGEIWFFDNHVIPLSKQLDEAKVFGVASDECLNCAIDNRKEWESKGRQIAQDMVLKCRKASISRD